jgi:hypothetical protein
MDSLVNSLELGFLGVGVMFIINFALVGLQFVVLQSPGAGKARTEARYRAR